MAAQRSQSVKSLSGINASPKTPSNAILTESVPVHIDSELELDTPLKDPTNTYKKKSGKLVSKRKLFLQSGQNLPVNKAKRHANPKTSNTSLLASLPTDSSRPNYPLTERQQLQYLLEVTAKEAKQESESCSSSDDNSKTGAKKDVNKENPIETRIRKRNERGETALHVAAIRGDLEDVVALVTAGALVNAKDNAGWTPLHEACNYGNLTIVQELVQSGADVNSPGYEAITPLHDAVINDHVEVVKFLLDNGADSKLQTSQNYSASDLARSEKVLYLLNPEQRKRNLYSVDIQENLAHPRYRDPNLNMPEIKINGLNSPFIQRNMSEDVLVVPIGTQDTKTSLSHSVLAQNIQDAEMHGNLQTNLVENRRIHNEKQNFGMQGLSVLYGFSENIYHCNDERENDKDREATEKRLLSKDVAEKNDNEPVKYDYAGWHFKRSPCHSVVSEEIQVNGNDEGVDKISESGAPEGLNLDINKDSFPNGFKPPITNDLGQMNVKHQPSKKPGLSLTSEFEEDTVEPEKLNECLDKAMIQISSYLETSQRVHVSEQASCEGRELNKCDLDEVRNDKTLVGKELSNGFVYAESAQRHKPLHTVSSLVNNCLEDQPYQISSPPKRTEHKEDEKDDKVLAQEEVCSEVTDTNCVDQQPHTDFTKIKLRHDRKKDGGATEKTTRSVRRKKLSRSSDVSKCSIYCGQTKEECTSHIRNSSWRADLPKYRHSMSAIPMFVPGYEDFLINSNSGLKSLSDEVITNPAMENQLERLISQHDTEKVKLRMTLEQELVRLFGNCARKSAGYQIPYSACVVISSQMRAPGMKLKLNTETEPTMSIKLDVDKILSKFNRLKMEMLKRHNREIEAIVALENLWTESKDLIGESRTATITSKFFSEDFDLLPPKFSDYYEEVLCATD